MKKCQIISYSWVYLAIWTEVCEYNRTIAVKSLNQLVCAFDYLYLFSNLWVANSKLLPFEKNAHINLSNLNIIYNYLSLSSVLKLN